MIRGKSNPACLVTLLVLFALQTNSVSAQLYTVTDLGDFPGGTDESVATAINDSGDVVGYSSGLDCGGNVSHKPFLWTAANGMQI